MRRIMLLFTVALVMAAMMALAGPAFANHQHYLLTPSGQCVNDVASGQTSRSATEPGGHVFHENVHLGASGKAAIEVGVAPCPTP